MNEKQSDNELTGWLSTYGIITAQRILGGYNIHLSSEDLIHALKTPGSYYHRLLLVPLENVFNGIILQQARDYQLYSQKLFIDYLLSGESSKGEDTQGASTREDLETIRKDLLAMNEDFHAAELAHETMIAKSQRVLMNNVKNSQQTMADGEMDDFHTEVKNMGVELRRFRSDFYNFIIRANELIKLLPEYKIDDEKNSENKAALHFDPTLGGSIENY